MCVRLQVKRNVQRTLAIELQKLSVQFRKQQKQHLNRLRQRDGGGAGGGSFLLEEAGPRGRAGAEDEYDPGFTEVQVRLGPRHVPPFLCWRIATFMLPNTALRQCCTLLRHTLNVRVFQLLIALLRAQSQCLVA